MTAVSVVPTFRHRAPENRPFGGFLAASCERRVSLSLAIGGSGLASLRDSGSHDLDSGKAMANRVKAFADRATAAARL